MRWRSAFAEPTSNWMIEKVEVAHDAQAMWLVPLAGLIFSTRDVRNTCSNLAIVSAAERMSPPGGAPMVVPGSARTVVGLARAPLAACGIRQPNGFPTCRQPRLAPGSCAGSAGHSAAPNPQPRCLRRLVPAPSSNPVESECSRSESPEPPRNTPGIQASMRPEAIDKEEPRSAKEPPRQRSPAVAGGFPVYPRFRDCRRKCLRGLPSAAGWSRLASRRMACGRGPRFHGAANDAADAHAGRESQVAVVVVSR